MELKWWLFQKSENVCLFVLYVWTCLKENTLLWSSVVDFDNWENNKNHLLSKSKMTWNHSTSGTGRFTKATTPNCTLDVDPCIEVLEHVANCINDALQNQSHNTTNNISVLLCCNPNTSHKHLHCINCSHNKGPKANATKGSGQSHLQTGEQQWPVCGEIPSAENPRICHVTHIVNYATSPVQHQKEAELQRTHHTFVLVRCILLVLDGERSKANRKQDHPSCTEEASQGRYSHHAGILIGDILPPSQQLQWWRECIEPSSTSHNPIDTSQPRWGWLQLSSFQFGPNTPGQRHPGCWGQEWHRGRCRPRGWDRPSQPWSKRRPWSNQPHFQPHMPSWW